MRYVTTFFWTGILGALIGYIGGALSNVSVNYEQAMVAALVAGSLGTILTYFISKNNAPQVKTSDESEAEA
ncbi:YjzD family protein [Weissella kandleri]|uniref:YjzD family protein n=1 Tax=Weissella kandleri TaxID=1616 RepID=UPI00387ED0ED